MSHLRDYNHHLAIIIGSFMRNLGDIATREEQYMTFFVLDVFLIVEFAGNLYAILLCDFTCIIIAVERCVLEKPARNADT
jgi:hypothetical protein